ncbi:hypothetical protein BEN78_06120 [Xanthomonas citri pv. mangiferaeindicae]|nr:hypothetical protein BEN78_06120 [Xanthomonas citri pv. mangiferaeindicae]
MKPDPALVAHPASDPARDASTAVDADDAALLKRFAASLQQAPYYSVGRTWEDYAPAYRLGLRSWRRTPGEDFETIAAQLERDWNATRGTSRLGWVEARGAVEAAWQHCAMDAASRQDAARRADRNA